MLEATVRCQTHKSVLVTVSWSIHRTSDNELHMDATLLPDRRRRENIQPRLFLDTAAKAATLRVTHRIGSIAPGETPAQGAARRASPRLTDSFIGAGTLTTSLDVGTSSGLKTCTLHGVFLHAGAYDVCMEVESAVDLETGAVLSVNDYAVSHPLQLIVDDLREC